VAEWPAQWYSWNGRLRLMFYFLIFVGFLVGVAQGTYDINFETFVVAACPALPLAWRFLRERGHCSAFRQWRRLQIRKAVSP